MITDPIGDTITRMRNAYLRSYTTVDVMYSKTIEALMLLLKNEGFIINFDVSQQEDSVAKKIKIELKYKEDGKPYISTLERISKPGLRKYAKYTKIPRVLNGLGIAVLSTPLGILSDKEARKRKVGGELLCKIY